MRAQVVLVHDDRILLCRHHTPTRDYWVLPGGSVEPGEPIADAAVREVHEETGLDVELSGLLFVDGPRADGVVEIRQPRYTFAGRIVGGELTSVEESKEGCGSNGYLAGAAWMPLESPEFDSATRDTLQLVMRALGEYSFESSSRTSVDAWQRAVLESGL